MQGLIHLYSGDGKGKTTAGIGLLIRALGRGKRCILLQFLKGTDTGELHILSDQPDLTILRGDPSMPFTFQMTAEQKKQTKALHENQLKEVQRLIQEEAVNLVILDEVCAACSTGLLDLSLIEQFIREKPEHLELVLTGRNPQPFMVECADYHTEMRAIRHPYEQGITAREGIEY